MTTTPEGDQVDGAAPHGPGARHATEGAAVTPATYHIMDENGFVLAVAVGIRSALRSVDFQTRWTDRPVHMRLVPDN